jgi:hypothetical protein
MKVYVCQTDALGDFLNCVTVLSGLNKSYGKYDLIIKSRAKRFKGLREFLLYQNLFSNVYFDDEVLIDSTTIMMGNWDYREEGNNPNRPSETNRYYNWLQDHYKMEFSIDDDFEATFPELDIVTPECIVGDRWKNDMTDDRRKSNTLAHLENFSFLDYTQDVLTNCFLIKRSTKPLITNFTGVAVLADLLKKESYIVWKPEDWNSEFVVGDNITWDNGRDINKVFNKHFYLDRNCKLVHEKNLKDLL